MAEQDVVARGTLAERTEAATVSSVVGMMSPELSAALGARTADVAGGTGVRVDAAPGFAFLNRVLAVGLDAPLSGAQLDEAADYQRGEGRPLAVLQLAPFVETPEAVALLEERGWRRGGTWAKTMREVGEPPAARTDLRIERVAAERADDYGRVQCIGMEMPLDLAPWCAAQVGAPDWHTFAAYDGDELVAMGALFVHGPCGQLSGAATLPEARGRGAQSALMAARIALARDLGLAYVTAETGSETPENPNPSLHTMHRAGLATLYERRNWLLDI